MRFFLTVAFVAIGSPSFSETAAARTEVCDAVSGIATDIMASRQAGKFAPDVIQSLEGSEHQNLSPIFTDLVVAAYSEPRFSSEDYKADAISDFAGAAWVECIKSQ